MKKTVSLFFILITLFVSCSAFAKHKHKHAQPPVSDNSDSTKHQQKEKHPHVGGTTWTLAIVVGDLSGKPISGATVSLPCSGLPSKTTGPDGKASFSGKAPCPCAEGQAVITTDKGCSLKLPVTCVSTFSASCNQ